MSTKEKVIHVLTKLFCIGTVICLATGLLAFALYIVAFIIGGSSAAALCAFVFNKLLPVLYRVSAVFALIGLVKMYLIGEKTFVLTKPEKEKSE